MIKSFSVSKFKDRISCGLHWQNAVILTAVAVIFFLLSSFTPYVYDDIAYHYCYTPGRSFFDINPETDMQISSFADIFLSVKGCFLSWTGRIVPSFVIYTVFWLGKVIFNMVNGIMASAVIYLICRHISGKDRVRPLQLAAISSLFFLCAPAPGLTLFWANGAIIYLWTAFFYLVLLLPYRNFLEYGKAGTNIKWHGIILFPVGIVACNANENVAVSIISVITLTIVFVRVKYRFIPLWMLSGLAGALIGGGLLFAAPGVYQRVVYEGYGDIPVFHNLFIQNAHLFHTIPVILTAALSLLICTFRRMSGSQRYPAFFYLLLILSAGYSMIFSPYVPGRAVFGAFIFMLCLLGTVWQQTDIRRCFRYAAVGILSVTALADAAFAWRDIAFTNRVCNARFQEMRRAEKAGEARSWVFRPVCGMSRCNALYKTDIIREDARHFLNRHYAVKYQQISVKTTPVPAVQGMTENIFPGEER